MLGYRSQLGGYVRAPSSRGVVMTVDRPGAAVASVGPIVGKASLPETALHAAEQDVRAPALEMHKTCGLAVGPVGCGQDRQRCGELDDVRVAA